MIHKIFYIGIFPVVLKTDFPAGTCHCGKHYRGFRNCADRCQRRGEQLRQHGLYRGTGYESGNDHGNWPLCVGAGDSGQVRYYTKIIEDYLLVYLMVNSVILLCLSWILKCYGLSPETTQLSYILVMIHNGMAMFLWPASFVLPNMLRACNDVRFTMVLSIFSMFVFRIGFSYIIGVNMGYGAIGVWIAMVLDWIFRVICFVGRYLSGHWLKTAGLSER